MHLTRPTVDAEKPQFISGSPQSMTPGHQQNLNDSAKTSTAVLCLRHSCGEPYRVARLPRPRRLQQASQPLAGKRPDHSADCQIENRLHEDCTLFKNSSFISFTCPDMSTRPIMLGRTIVARNMSRN